MEKNELNSCLGTLAAVTIAKTVDNINKLVDVFMIW